MGSNILGKKYLQYLLPSVTTISDEPEESSSAREQLLDFCMDNGIPMKAAYRIGLKCEEMVLYTSQHRKEKGDIDLLLIIGEDENAWCFRSIGVPFAPDKKSDDDIEEDVLQQKVAAEISYDYSMGRNNPRIRIARG